jgi:hypothetical protein
VRGSGITSLAGLETIREIDGAFSIQGAEDLLTLEGFKGLALVQSYINIEGATSLVSVELPELRSVAGGINVVFSPSVKEILLPQLIALTGTNTILGCSALSSIRMDAVETSEELIVSQNEELTTLHGLPSLKSGGKLTMNGNPKLSQCEVDDIAERFSTCPVCDDNDSASPCN